MSAQLAAQIMSAAAIQVTTGTVLSAQLHQHRATRILAQASRIPTATAQLAVQVTHADAIPATHGAADHAQAAAVLLFQNAAQHQQPRAMIQQAI